MALAVLLLKWVIPDVPSEVLEKTRRETYLTNEIIIKQEMARARGISGVGDSTGMNPFPDGIELQPLAPITSNNLRNRQPDSGRGDGDKISEVMV